MLIGFSSTDMNNAFIQLSSQRLTGWSSAEASFYPFSLLYTRGPPLDAVEVRQRQRQLEGRCRARNSPNIPMPPSPVVEYSTWYLLPAWLSESTHQSFFIVDDKNFPGWR
jgi:hypothetical protein